MSLQRPCGVCLGSRLTTSNEDDRIQLPDHGDIDPTHAIIVRSSPQERYWLVDNASRTGTYLNGQAIRVAMLHGGDLIQIGPFAWTFSGADAWLTPAGRIDGVRLQLRQVSVRDAAGGDLLLHDVNCEILPGQLTAVVGPSGSGKSTLIRAILRHHGVRRAGELIADGIDVDKCPDWYRGLLGYVSQERAVHADLTALEVVEFSARLRMGDRGPSWRRAEQALHEAGLRETEWKKRVDVLSGGEDKRVRSAAELVAGPRLLVMDEPASGLDRHREVRLVRLLRELCLRGCTVVVVTHNWRHLEEFDHILVVAGETVCFEGSPETLRALVPGGSLADLDPVALSKGCTPPSQPSPMALASRPQNVHSRWRRMMRQGRLLAARETTLIGNRLGKRLLVPLGLLPTFFAIAIGLAVPPTQPALLGFLSVLACIWMGASLSLMSIVDEREVYDHERLLFLNVGPYITAKTGVLWVVSFFQTGWFLILLDVIRSGLAHNASLNGLPWCLVYLSLVGCVAVGLGLVISAFANRHKPLANFLLPLAMIAQIVFSVHVAGRGSAPLEDAYGEFHVHMCEHRLMGEPCRHRAQDWSTSNGWRCDKCIRDARRQPILGEDSSNRSRPNWLASLASYGTIARYGDIILRSLAYTKSASKAVVGDADRPHDPAYRAARWRHEAVIMLVIACVGLPALAGCILRWQHLVLISVLRSWRGLSAYRLRTEYRNKRRTAQRSALPVTPL